MHICNCDFLSLSEKIVAILSLHNPFTSVLYEGNECICGKPHSPFANGVPLGLLSLNESEVSQNLFHIKSSQSLRLL